MKNKAVSKSQRTGEARVAGTKILAARVVAFEVLMRVETGGAFASALLPNSANDLSAVDRALAHELTLGVLRWQLFLDSLIQAAAQRKIEKLDAAVRVALRLGFYQLRFMTRVPPSAAVNESVNLVKRARLKSAAPFVNAVLRRALRQPDELSKIESGNSVERLAIEVSHPAWLIEKWIEAFGEDEAKALALANNDTPHKAFRLSRQSVDAAQVLEKLRGAGGEVEASKIVKDAWRVRGATGAVRELADAGDIYLQDEASQLVAHIVAAKAGERVLDVCAAPGSKTSHIAMLEPNAALLVAGDIHPHRLRVMRELFERKSLPPANLIAYDAARKIDNAEHINMRGAVGNVFDNAVGGFASTNDADCLPFRAEAFDTVLVDAPCSGTGTLRHNPEIKSRLRADDLNALANRQLKILAHAARCVRRGGRLIYSTCSVENEENELVIERFLRDVAGWKLIEVDVDDELINRKVLESKTARTFPHLHGTEGFFIAKLQRD